MKIPPNNGPTSSPVLCGKDTLTSCHASFPPSYPSAQPSWLLLFSQRYVGFQRQEQHVTNRPPQTLPGKHKRHLVDEEPALACSSSDAAIDIPEEDVKPHSVKELLSIPVLRAVFAASSALGFAGSSFNSGFVLMAYTPLEQGGLALSVRSCVPLSGAKRSACC